MAILSDELLAQRAQDVGLLDERQLQTAWSELSSRGGVDGNLEQLLLRRELLTNYQVERLQAGHRTGFYYGKYKLLYAVGAGTFARVYRAAQRDTNKIVAVKVLRNRFSQDKDQADYFYREGQLGHSLKHPNIVPIYEVFSKGSVHYMVMEFVEGRNLREFLKIRKQFEPLEASKLILDIASGLEYSTGRGISHRDLKASNVLISSRGRAKLVDFGLAGADGALSDEAIADLPNPRTIDYAGLERATGVRRDDARSDIFFAGCLYYHMVSGKPALVETRDRLQRLSKARFEEIPPILDVAPELPLPVAMVVNKAIEFNPEKRYQTPSELVTDLNNLTRRLKRQARNGDSSSAEATGEEGSREDGQPWTLMVVEADVKMQNTLRDALKKKGYRVLVTSDPGRARTRFQDDSEVADLVLLSAAALGRDALEAFNLFGSEPDTKKVPAILLLRDSQRSWEDEALISPHRTVASLPIKLRELRSLLRSLLSSRENS